MGFTRSIKDLKIIQKLSDYPNMEDRLSAEDLKVKFDEGAETVQNDLNTLMKEMEEKTGAENLGAMRLGDGDNSENTVQAKLIYLLGQIQSQALGQIPDGTITRAKMEEEYKKTIAEKNGEMQRDLNAEMVGGRTAEKILEEASENKPYVIGTYIGDDKATQMINLEFTPNAVHVRGQKSIYLGEMAFATREYPSKGTYDITVEIVENGFVVHKESTASRDANKINEPYNYIAFK